MRGVHGLGFGAGFVFLGLGSTVFSYLLLKSRVVPRWLAVWGVAASALMAVCSLLMMQLPGMASLLQIVSFAPRGAFELTMGGWLLLKGAAFGEPYGQESRS